MTRRRGAAPDHAAERDGIAAAMIPEAAAHGKPSAVGLSTLAGFLAAVAFKLLE